MGEMTDLKVTLADINNPNEIWDDIENFLRGRLFFISKDLYYPDLSKYDPKERENIIASVLEGLVMEEYRFYAAGLYFEWMEKRKRKK